MKKSSVKMLLIPLAVALGVVLPAWSGVRTPQAVDDPRGGPDPQGVSAGIFSLAASQACPGCVITEFRREPVVDNIVHYRLKVRIGPGPYDVIGLHRVVKEKRPFVPAQTRDGLFLLHGSVFGFEAAFLGNLTTGMMPPSHAMPVYLAKNGWDVWGMDLGWVFTPAGETDFSSYADWGLAKEVSQIRSGLAFARAGRGLTTGDWAPMNYMAWSYGAFLGYILLEDEAQMPEPQRLVKGFVIADIAFKIGDESARQTFCDWAALYHQMQDSGIYGDGSAAIFSTLGSLAIADPQGESPILPPLNNAQAILYFGAAPGIYLPYPSSFHLVAGTFGPDGMPTGLQYLQPDYFTHFALGAAPWAPTLTGVEQLDIWCGQVDSPFDDHLADITVPVLYLGAAGGVGETGIYSTTLLGSRDVTSLVVRAWPEGQEPMDVGHIDLFNADNAQDLVWQPVLNWLKRH